MVEIDVLASSSSQSCYWWVFHAWIRRDGVFHFVFGCAAPWERAAPDRDEKRDLVDGLELLIVERIIDPVAFANLSAQLDGGAIALSGLTKDPAPAVPVRATRRVTQSGFGYTAAQARLFYSLPDVTAMLGDGEAGLEPLLSALEDELNLPFKTSYAARLGNFEIFDLPDWHGGTQPFLAEVKRTPGSKPEVVDLRRTGAFAANAHAAHISGRVAGDIVLDQLVELPRGMTTVSLPIPEPLDAIEFRLFDVPDGKLLHSEAHQFINRVSFAIGVLGRQINLQDKLSADARATNARLGARAAGVASVTPQRGSVGMPKPGSWRKFRDDMEDLAAARLPGPSEDRWFPRGIEGELDAILHLNSLLNGASIASAILVDPWFGVDALHRFALRLSSNGLPLTIVTSWTTSDPDTGSPFDSSQVPTAALAAALEQVKLFLNVRLSVINLADGGRQAFHDRYLLLRPYDRPVKVFLLSNSLNRIAGNWPFAMSLLAPDMARGVRQYVDGLLRGFDTARNRALDVTLRWPDGA